MVHDYESGCEKWVTVDEVPTSVQVWGGWTAEEMPTDTLILVVTGNPGITDFYVNFMKQLQAKCGGHAVWVIGHAGHSHHPDCPSLTCRPELFDLKGQVAHKAKFVRAYVPATKKLILVGHSIGAKICVELMKDASIASRVEQAHLAMPCLEHISETRNGRWFQTLGVRIFPVLAWLVQFLMYVPLTVQMYILKIGSAIRFCTMRFDECLLHGVLKLIGPGVIDQAVFLARDEMRQVLDLDHEVYEAQGSKVFAYYCQRDGWSPLTQYERLRKRHRNVTTVVLNKRFEHAFMIHHAAEMADEIALNVEAKTVNRSLTSQT